MSAKKVILIILILLFAIGLVGGAAYFYVRAEIKKPFNAAGYNKTFIISSGERTEQIGNNLFKEGFIRDSFYFKFYLWSAKGVDSIKAGEYNLSPAMNIPGIVEIITQGKIVDTEVSIMIPEGLTVSEIEKILVANNLLKSGELREISDKKELRSKYRYGFLEDKPENSGLEGYLFPDTYKFYKKTIPEDVLQKILGNFDKKFDGEMRVEAAKQEKSVFEILTLASIVQKEANGPDDMKIVAGIFQNRLEIGMALEADSTINFITGKKMPQALYSDLENFSPYNTYKNIGLPPGPINNPGLDAIKAVIWPQKSDYLYFLHSPEGKAYYGKTYQEHLKNRAKYLPN